MLLQRTVLSAFADVDAWMIAIFDNFLIGADNYPDLIVRLKIFFAPCKEQNMTKSWFGVKEVTFFGFHLKYHLVSLSDKRKRKYRN